VRRSEDMLWEMEAELVFPDCYIKSGSGKCYVRIKVVLWDALSISADNG
jgi:hypothetical protein